MIRYLGVTQPTEIKNTDFVYESMVPKTFQKAEKVDAWHTIMFDAQHFDVHNVFKSL